MPPPLTLNPPYQHKSLRKGGFCIGDPNEIRTRVAALRGPRPRPLDDGTINKLHRL